MKTELKNSNSSRKSGGKRHQQNGSCRVRTSCLENRGNNQPRIMEKKLIIQETWDTIKKIYKLWIQRKKTPRAMAETRSTGENYPSWEKTHLYRHTKYTGHVTDRAEKKPLPPPSARECRIHREATGSCKRTAHITYTGKPIGPAADLSMETKGQKIPEPCDSKF